MGRVEGGPAENQQNSRNPGVNNSDIPVPTQFPPTAVQFPPPTQEAAVQFSPPAPEPLVHPFPQPIRLNHDTNQSQYYSLPLVPNLQSWNTQLFDCMDDPTNAIITCCFPCITFGQIAEILDNGQTPCATSGIVYTFMSWFVILQCIYSSTYRFKLRNKFHLVEAPAPDWITHLLFEPCALSQAYRELQRRGIDPTIGWIGNVAKLQQEQQQRQPQAAINPPSHQIMY